MRHLNLIFQGGGVKGIAYAGALHSLTPDYRIHGVGGTSAGALVAALLAIGAEPKELQDILRDPELFNLLDAEEMERYRRLRKDMERLSDWKKATAGLGPLWASLRKGKWGKVQAWRGYGKFQEENAELLERIDGLLHDVQECWAGRGAHSTTKLRDWLRKRLGSATFESVWKERNVDLRIVAADVGQRKYLIYDHVKHGGTTLLDAVHASVSVPIFFRPIISTRDECLVDGGIVSNFPSFLFDQSPYPTVGFRLREAGAKRDPRIDSPLDYLLALAETMTTAHDEFRGRLQSFRSYDIDTPAGIAFDKFDLTQDDADKLYHAGVAVGDKVTWMEDDHSSKTELVKYFDPDPHKVLASALQQAQGLIKEHLSPAAWVDEIEQTSAISAQIEDDWTVHYDRKDVITVKGDGVLILQRGLVQVQPEAGRKLSLNQIKPVFVEEANGGQTPLRYIPAFNDDGQKGFAFFYSPPIGGAHSGPRTFRQHLTIDKEFAQTLGRGSGEKVAFRVVQRARKHIVTAASLHVRVHPRLPQVTFDPPPDTSALEAHNGLEYRVYNWVLKRDQLQGDLHYEVEIHLTN